MADHFPVFVSVTRDDGRSEQVRIGTATRAGEGFNLSFDNLSIGGSPVAARSAPARASSSASSSRSSGGPGPSADGLVFPPYGRSKGMPVSGASMQDLEFYANGSRRTLSDPSKERFHGKERAFLAALEAEIARQRGESPSSGGGDDDVPPPGDEDAPF